MILEEKSRGGWQSLVKAALGNRLRSDIYHAAKEPAHHHALTVICLFRSRLTRGRNRGYARAEAGWRASASKSGATTRLIAVQSVRYTSDGFQLQSTVGSSERRAILKNSKGKQLRSFRSHGCGARIFQMAVRVLLSLGCGDLDRPWAPPPLCYSPRQVRKFPHLQKTLLIVLENKPAKG